MNNKPTVEIVIPVYNEEKELKENILKLVGFCGRKLSFYSWEIVIADNASIDQTSVIGKDLEKANKKVRYIRFTQKGRGRAVKKVWKDSSADICVYMDVDLSTDLDHLPAVVGSLVNGYDMATGSRLLKGSRVIERSIKREFISRMYNLIIKLFFQTKFSDAQCGFKAVSKNVVKRLLPHIKDNGWFMDSELLIIGEKVGYKIHEEPVIWHDNPGSTVRILPTAFGDFKGLLRLFVTRPWKMITKS